MDETDQTFAPSGEEIDAAWQVLRDAPSPLQHQYVRRRSMQRGSRAMQSVLIYQDEDRRFELISLS
jgi:hypothetical protein